MNSMYTSPCLEFFSRDLFVCVYTGAIYYSTELKPFKAFAAMMLF